MNKNFFSGFLLLILIMSSMLPSHVQIHPHMGVDLETFDLYPCSSSLWNVIHMAVQKQALFYGTICP